MFRDHFRHGHVHGNLLGHTELVQTQVGVGCDDRASGEIDTLTHQVTSKSALFSLKTRPNCLNGLTRFMLLGSGAFNTVVHNGGDVELQHLALLLNDGLRVTRLNGALNFVVLLDHLLVRKSQVIFRSSGASHHCDGGTDWWRRDCQVVNDHVGGVRLVLVKSEAFEVLRLNLVEDSLSLLGPKDLLAIVIRPLGIGVQDGVLNSHGAFTVVVVGHRAFLALLEVGAKPLHCVETRLLVRDLGQIF